MSTRAIASVTNSGVATIHRDLTAGVPNGTPGPAVDRETGEILDEPTPL